MGIAGAEWPPRWLSVALPVAQFACIYLNVTIRLEGLWIVNSFLLVALLRNRLATWPALIFLTMIGDALAWAVAAPGPGRVIDVIADLLVPLLIAAAMRRFAGSDTWFLSIRWIGLFLLSCIVSMATVVAWMVLCWNVLLDAAPSGSPGFLAMLLDGCFGVVIGTPLLLCWTDRQLARQEKRSRWLETAGYAAIIFLLCRLGFTSQIPSLYLLFPCLALLTLRGGLIGSTIGLVIVTGLGAWYSGQGLGPLAEAAADPGQRILFTQLFFLAAIFSTLPLAIALGLRESAVRRLEREHQISEAALNNMAQGLCMFDAGERLIICNGRYAELYSLPASLTLPGTPFADIVEQQVATAAEQNMPEPRIAKLGASAVSAAARSELELPDGRIIDIHRKPLPNGGWVSTHEDVTDSRRAAQHIAHLANHDPLTNLPNRGYFHEQLQRSAAQAERGHGFALHCLDLDLFKQVNDTLGHGAGDELLRQVSTRLRDAVRDGDLVARLGGDEFAILQFPVTAREEAGTLGARVVRALAQPFNLDGREAAIGVSVGTALAPLHTLNPAELLQKADLALYQAKADGRGAHRFFEAGMDDDVRARRVIESELGAAVRKGEFELFFQPIMDVRSQAIGSFEALIRWRHPIRGIVPPAEFIPIAEETGLIVQLGDWVLRQACAEAAKWPEGIKVAVNLSPIQFKSANLLATVTGALAASGLDPRRLELEVTESVLMQRSHTVIKLIEQLSALGISLVLDDFGTGYSSLSYLRTYPFSKVKIDRSFVGDLSNADSRAIVHATVQLSTSLGMTTTAEGVETAEQLAALEAEGCTNIQGYHIGPPLPARSIAAAIERHGFAGADRQLGGPGAEPRRPAPAPLPVLEHRAKPRRRRSAR